MRIIRFISFVVATLAIYRFNSLLFFKVYLNNLGQRQKIKQSLKNRLFEQLTYSVSNVEYYKKYELEMAGMDISNILDKYDSLPILKKQDVVKNRDSLISSSFEKSKLIERRTGGSTGETLSFYVSDTDLVISNALLHRGWHRGGYRLGNKIAIIAGGSLVSKKLNIRTKITDYFLSYRRFSSYGVDEKKLEEYCLELNRFKPLFLRGYASSLYLLANYIAKSKSELNYKLSAIFTTSEMLSFEQRCFIEKVFKAKVFDGYGLDDGGLTAFECQYNDGYHIDIDRSYLEVVNDSGKLVFGEVGRIIATNLTEKGMPLIRYETGDLGILTPRVCKCGEENYLLTSLSGRTTDTLDFGGTLIGGPVLTVLMGQTSAKQYQFIQTSENSLQINIVSDDKFKKDEMLIRQSLESHVENISVTFNYVDIIVPVEGKKHKFILRLD